MTVTQITDNDKLTALKHLANGRLPAFVAAAVGTDEDAVTALGEEYGWPDRERLRWSVDELERQARVNARAELPKASATTAAHATGITHPVRRSPMSQPSTQATAPNPARPVVDSLAGMLRRADQIDDGPGAAKVRNAAKKLRAAGVVLEHALNDLETKHRAAREEAQRKAELRADVDRLEKQLAAKKAALRGATTTRPASSTDGETPARTIRAWAAEHDVDCPPVGRVPADVREQYEQAHRSDAA